MSPMTAIGVGPGDEVVVPAHTFIATWLAVQQCGAVPVPVEPDPRTYLINGWNDYYNYKNSGYWEHTFNHDVGAFPARTVAGVGEMPVRRMPARVPSSPCARAPRRPPP